MLKNYFVFFIEGSHVFVATSLAGKLKHCFVLQHAFEEEYLHTAKLRKEYATHKLVY